MATVSKAGPFYNKWNSSAGYNDIGPYDGGRH